jgi:host factor-I protein
MPEDPSEEIEEPSEPEGEAADAEELEAEDSPAPAPRGGGPSGPRNNTQQEAAYLRRLIDQNIPVSVKIRGGELVSGVIEYYDSSFIRLTREGQSNLFIFKKDILYLREDAPLGGEDAPLGGEDAPLGDKDAPLAETTPVETATS